jgi:uncharacterized protein YwgA
MSKQKLKEIVTRLGFLKYGRAHENSVKTQAIVYLLQQMGVELGYEFEMNVRGVYSKKLAEDIHTLYPKALSYEASESAGNPKLDGGICSHELSKPEKPKKVRK